MGFLYLIVLRFYEEEGFWYCRKGFMIGKGEVVFFDIVFVKYFICVMLINFY